LTFLTEKIMQIITAKVNTKLKKLPVESSLLKPEQIVLVPARKSYGVERIELADNGHIKVILAANSGTFYAFTQHWEGLDLNESQPLVIPEQTEQPLITQEEAEAIFGNPITKDELTDLNCCLKRYEINTPARLCHFLSQIAHESGGLRWLQELGDGYYLEGRSDLGNTCLGDGPKYKGSGAIQLTGRSNYQAFCDVIGDSKIMNGCDYVAQTYPFTSAGFWWQNNKMNELCDRGATVEEITRRVNGGYNGLEDRQQYYEKACQVINSRKTSQTPATPQEATLTIKFIHTTTLRLVIEDVAELSSEQQVEVPEQTVCQVQSYAYQTGDYLKVAFLDKLFNGKNTWFVHSKDVELCNPQLEIKPKKILLPVPWFPQTDNYRDAERTCNSSSCAMCLEYFRPGTLPGECGDDKYVEVVFQYGDTTDHQVQTQALSHFGLNSTWHTDLDFEDVYRELEANRPVVIGIYHRGTTEHPCGGHMIVVRGRTEDGDFIVNDPYGSLNDRYTGAVENGKGAIYSKNEMTYRWTADGLGTGWGRLFQP
jgi:predicted chitinase